MFGFRSKKFDLSSEIMTVHDYLVKDIFKYFEKGSSVKRQFRRTRKFVKKAFRFTRKKKMDSLEILNQAQNEIKVIQEDLLIAKKALTATFSKLEQILKIIEEARITKPIAIIENSKKLIRNRKFQEATQSLNILKVETEVKPLGSIRNSVFGGINDDVKYLRQEIMEKSIKS